MPGKCWLRWCRIGFLVAVAMGVVLSTTRAKHNSSLSQIQNVLNVVKITKDYFPTAALPHLIVEYDYSVLHKTQTLQVSRLEFFLPSQKFPDSSVLKARLVKLFKQFGRKDIECLNFEVGKRTQRFSGYIRPLKSVKVHFACG